MIEIDYLSWYCEVVNRTWRAANFLYERWQTYEAGEENYQGIRDLSPETKQGKDQMSIAVQN
jgi:hypothetical protein